MTGFGDLVFGFAQTVVLSPAEIAVIDNSEDDGDGHDGDEIDKGVDVEQKTRRDLFRNVTLQWIIL